MECRGFPWKLQWIDVREIAVAIAAVAIAVEFRGNCHVLEDCRGNCRGWSRNAVGFRGNCRGLTSVEIAVKIALDSVAVASSWRIAVAIAADGHGMPRKAVEIAVV